MENKFSKEKKILEQKTFKQLMNQISYHMITSLPLVLGCLIWPPDVKCRQIWSHEWDSFQLA